MEILKSPLGRFRVIAFLEGISYLALFFVSMPLKYIYGITEPNKVIGMAHGFLFVFYVILMFPAADERNWDMKKKIVVFLLSLLPFGTFWGEKKYFS